MLAPAGNRYDNKITDHFPHTFPFVIPYFLHISLLHTSNDKMVLYEHHKLLVRNFVAYPTEFEGKHDFQYKYERSESFQPSVACWSEKKTPTQ